MELENKQKLFGGIYKSKKVFVTGHTGFKGSWLTYWLLKLGANITGYSINKPTKPNHFDLLDLPINSIVGDVLNKKQLDLALSKCNPDIVFHLAAQPLVRKSFLQPLETLETNIMGTANLLESCRRIKNIKAIVIVTSDKCYQDTGSRRGYKEIDPLGGNDPYSASKACVEIVANSYRKSFFSRATLLASVRAGNVIGGGDWAVDRIIPDMVRAVNRGEKVILRNPNAIRPWQHVLEPLSGYLLLGSKLLAGNKKYAESWNFGPNPSSNLKVEQLVKLSQRFWKKLDFIIDKKGSNIKETQVLTLDSSKSKHMLYWEPVWNTVETIERTMTWYDKYYTKSEIMSNSDIERYILAARKKSIKWTA